MENKKAEKWEKTMESGKFDPNGMYTGTPLDKNDKPEQDADDL